MASNNVLYESPVYDPWFAATRPTTLSGPDFSARVYMPDEYINAMACTDQYQICNPTSNPFNCTIIGGVNDINLGLGQIGLNSQQLATAYRFETVLIPSNTYVVVNYLGATALLARDRLAQFTGLGLPDNQWQLEVQGWFETSLSIIQGLIVEYVANRADLGPYGKVDVQNAADGPVSKAAVDLCSNQRIRNIGGYQSFSFSGVIILVCIGLTIILLSWIIEPLCGYIRARRARDPSSQRDIHYREIARVADHKLQLHRMALSGFGYEQGWENNAQDIPITAKGFEFPGALGERISGGGVRYYYPESRGKTSKEAYGPHIDGGLPASSSTAAPEDNAGPVPGISDEVSTGTTVEVTPEAAPPTDTVGTVEASPNTTVEAIPDTSDANAPEGVSEASDAVVPEGTTDSEPQVSTTAREGSLRNLVSR